MSVASNNIRMGANNGFDDDCLYLLPQCMPVASLLFQIFPKCLQAPLVSFEFRFVGTMLKIFIILVDCIVGKMDELIPKIFLVGVEGFCCKPHQSIIV